MSKGPAHPEPYRPTAEAVRQKISETAKAKRRNVLIHTPAECRDPISPDEWQDAVDHAHFYLALDAAQKYGLVTVTGGPNINIDRCIELLEGGAARGFTPRADAIERGVKQINGIAE